MARKAYTGATRSVRGRISRSPNLIAYLATSFRRGDRRSRGFTPGDYKGDIATRYGTRLGDVRAGDAAPKATPDQRKF